MPYSAAVPPGDLSAQRLGTAVVPVDEVIDAIKDEEEAQLTVRKRSVASANDADPLKGVARSLSLKNRRRDAAFSLSQRQQPLRDSRRSRTWPKLRPPPTER
jgi:hypothetical protein